MKKCFTIALLAIGLMAKSQMPEIGGYLKYLPSQTFVNKGVLPSYAQDLLPSSFDDHLIHNRLNVRWFSKPYSLGEFSFELGMRNRIFHGYQSSQPGFASSLESDPGSVDMRWLWNEPGDELLFHSEFDRLNLTWMQGEWTVRVGRQRINWGIHNVFNPNDIFNQYNYFDFDYEERPGADALLVQRYLGDGFSSIEVAYSPNFSDVNQSTGAVLYKSNFKGYDWQVLAGYSFYDVVIAGGWAGSIGGAGFKGEAAYYQTTDEALSNSNFTMSLGGDYQFSNGIYSAVSVLYNEQGRLNPSIFDQLALQQTRLSSKNIFPYRWTFMVNASYPINPLWGVSMAWFQSHNLDQAAFIPGVTYSIANNWDAMLTAQIFSVRDQDENLALFNSAIFGRVKWSF